MAAGDTPGCNDAHALAIIVVTVVLCNVAGWLLVVVFIVALEEGRFAESSIVAILSIFILVLLLLFES
jgi:hypothetical protein